ncbi:hypothetical protein OVA14_04175 [Agrococcus sp. SL85]|uniref:hypothetical protein n=1 Tax=Agrococcus sp. SL85 TaxID=2995141 RepID=UPI00226D2596|nr:hypothetical protein [Agrococcus sp. SL85]WAC66969.1 hypothetical protein OVA14_04175 [Agrococcus sp. SL85]
MTEAQAAIVAARAAAAEEARLAELAVRRAIGLAREARELVGLQGDEGWLGPARTAFDGTCERERHALDGEEQELLLLGSALRGVR